MISIAECDRALYDLLRKEIVRQGYFPDINLFTGSGNCDSSSQSISNSTSESGSSSSISQSIGSSSSYETNAEAFEAAKQKIRDSGKELIELFKKMELNPDYPISLCSKL